MKEVYWHSNWWLQILPSIWKKPQKMLVLSSFDRTKFRYILYFFNLRSQFFFSENYMIERWEKWRGRMSIHLLFFFLFFSFFFLALCIMLIALKSSFEYAEREWCKLAYLIRETKMTNLCGLYRSIRRRYLCVRVVFFSFFSSANRTQTTNLGGLRTV